MIRLMEKILHHLGCPKSINSMVQDFFHQQYGAEIPSIVSYFLKTVRKTTTWAIHKKQAPKTIYIKIVLWIAQRLDPSVEAGEYRSNPSTKSFGIHPWFAEQWFQPQKIVEVGKTLSQKKFQTTFASIPSNPAKSMEYHKSFGIGFEV